MSEILIEIYFFNLFFVVISKIASIKNNKNIAEQMVEHIKTIVLNPTKSISPLCKNRSVSSAMGKR